jgi:hypothetical protein
MFQFCQVALVKDLLEIQFQGKHPLIVIVLRIVRLKGVL